MPLFVFKLEQSVTSTGPPSYLCEEEGEIALAGTPSFQEELIIRAITRSSSEHVNPERQCLVDVQLPSHSYDVLPPAYTPLDESLHFFSIRDGFIYAAPRISGADSTPFPRYQLLVQNTRSGKPLLLKIRRLLASESRIAATGSREVEFDDDTTLYTIENLGVKVLRLSSKFGSVEIRGRQRGTLKGYIELQTSGIKPSTANHHSFGGYQKLWHITKNAEGDALRQENAAKIQKYGYRPSDEINRDLLFSVRNGPRIKEVQWKDPRGQPVATETDSKSIEILDNVNLKTRDLIVTCWCARQWVQGAMD
jgi:hypothetical protein